MAQKLHLWIRLQAVIWSCFHSAQVVATELSVSGGVASFARLRPLQAQHFWFSWIQFVGEDNLKQSVFFFEKWVMHNLWFASFWLVNH